MIKSSLAENKKTNEPLPLGKKVKKLREEHQMSQEVLASKLSVDRSSLCQAEIGNRKFQVEEVEKLADIFNLTVDQLLGRMPVPEVILEPSSGQPIPQVKNQQALKVEVPQQRVEKFREVLLYILNQVGGKPNVGETVLYKLLYFIDFNFYELYREQLIGATYIKNIYGPTPVEFQKIAQEMVEKGDIEMVQSKHFEYPQKKYLAVRQPNMTCLSARELALIDHTLRTLSDMTAKKISEYSHGDIPWMKAEEGKVISYDLVRKRVHPYSMVMQESNAVA